MTTNGTEKRPLPDGWTWTTVKNVAEINYGKGLPKRDRNDEGIIPVYGSSGITGYHSESIVEGPCLIIGRKGAAGAVHLSMTDCWPIDTTYYASLKSIISLKYAFYVLKTLELESLDRSTAIPSLSRDDLYVQSLPLAPLPEQERIVAEIEKQFTRLDQAVASLRRLQGSLARYKASVLKAACEGRLVPQDPTDEPADQLLERILSERRAQWQAANPGKKYKEPVGVEGETAVLPDLPEGWAWVELDHVSFVTKLAGFEYTKFVNYDDEGDLPVVKAENVKNDGFRATDFSYVDSKSVSHLTRSKLEAFDLLMVFVGANLGNVALLPPDKEYFLGPNVAMIRLKTSMLLPKFVEIYLRSPLGIQSINRLSKATAQGSISMGSIRQIPTPVPPLTEQERIVAEVERRLSVVTAIEQTITANLSRAERLRQSILHRAFTGQL